MMYFESNRNGLIYILSQMEVKIKYYLTHEVIAPLISNSISCQIAPKFEIFLTISIDYYYFYPMSLIWLKQFKLKLPNSRNVLNLI